MMAKFDIRAKNKSVVKNWHLLNKEIPEQMQRLKQFLQENPEDRLLARGKLKKLKGKLKGILQYDITDNYRIHYTVDSVKRTVYVEYIGTHP